MKKKLNRLVPSASCLVLSAALCAVGLSAFAAEPTPLLVPDYTSLAAIGKPRVIIDTDLGSSMDDLFTVDLAARMHKAGGVQVKVTAER